MNLFKQEIRQNASSTIIWMVSLIVIASLYVWIYPTLVEGANFSEILSNFPEAFKKSFGINDESFSAFNGLYATVLTFVILAGAIQAMNLGTGINAKEISSNTADFLLTKPISRNKILSYKILSSLSLLLLTNLVFIAAVWVIIQLVIVDSFTFNTYLLSTLALFIIQSFFFGLGFLLGVLLPKVKSVISLTLPTVFGLYIFGLLDTVIGEERIRYLTPFKFFNLNSLTAGGGYEYGFIIYVTIVLLIVLSATFYFWRKKDIHAL